jgi:hypothetical protein
MAVTAILPAHGANPKLGAVDADALPAGDFTGKLVTTPGTDRIFTVQVVYQQLQLKNPNQNYAGNAAAQNLIRQQAQLQREINQMRRSRNPGAQLAKIQRTSANMEAQALKAQLSMFKVVTAYQNVDFQAEELMKVRYMNPPKVYDDKGEPRKYTSAELKELKGASTNLPGYEGSLETLEKGQTVQVTLRQHKKPKPTSTANKDSDKDMDKEKEKEKDKDPDTTSQHRMQVQMVVILSEIQQGPRAAAIPEPSKKKN